MTDTSPYRHTSKETCEKKKKYRRRREAVKAASALYQRHGELYPYACTICEGYHLSSKPYISDAVLAEENGNTPEGAKDADSDPGLF